MNKSSFTQTDSRQKYKIYFIAADFYKEFMLFYKKYISLQPFMIHNNMKQYIILLSVLFSLFFAACRQKQLLDKEMFITHYEQHGYSRTPRYAETVAYCKLLAANSSKVHYTTIGTSPQGREIPLLIVDKDGYTTVSQARKNGRIIVLAEACIHAGEPDGKDAGLMFIRDMALFDEHPGLLEHVTFLFIPVLNVDGHEDFGEHYRINQNGPIEVGARFTAQRYNMNRDFVKADAPETRSLLKLYNEWMPEVFVDIHVTNGADFQYVSTYGSDRCGFLAQPILDWSINVFEKELCLRMEQDGFPIFPYYDPVTNPAYAVPGAIISDFAPLYSNGYAYANNRIGLLIENHIYKPYKDRVDASYLYLKNILKIAENHAESLKTLVAKTDAYVSSPEFRKDSLALAYQADMSNPTKIPFLAWKDTAVVSDLSGGVWRYYDYQSPVTVDYWLYQSYTGERKIKLPEAYIIPQEELQTIDLLDVHNIEYTRLPKDETLQVESYHFTKAEWARTPYEGRITLNTEYIPVKESITYRAGDVFVTTAQPKVQLIAHLLEPKSPTSLVYWGFYNNFVAVPNEFYVRLNYMEVKGRELLEKDPALKAAFEAKKLNDPAFAQDSNAILNFFMAKVREQVGLSVNRYPVGRIL